jgi:membrane associated rhomboid family serine protease
VLPIRDNVRGKGFSIINLLLIAANIYVFWLEMHQGRRLDAFVFRYGLVPAVWTSRKWALKLTLSRKLEPVFTSMFLHGGWLHIIGNMWMLYIFGQAVEARLGHLRYLNFYLASGVASGLVHLWANWGSPIPTIGASGAIAGVMGAYLVFFPLARISTLVPLFIFFYTVEIPAFFYLGLWFVTQVLSNAGSLGADFGIAWWAHIGGFAFGALFARSFQKKAGRRQAPYLAAT